MQNPIETNPVHPYSAPLKRMVPDHLHAAALKVITNSTHVTVESRKRGPGNLDHHAELNGDLTSIQQWRELVDHPCVHGQLSSAAFMVARVLVEESLTDITLPEVISAAEPDLDQLVGEQLLTRGALSHAVLELLADETLIRSLLEEEFMLFSRERKPDEGLEAFVNTQSIAVRLFEAPSSSMPPVLVIETTRRQLVDEHKSIRPWMDLTHFILNEMDIQQACVTCAVTNLRETKDAAFTITGITGTYDGNPWDLPEDIYAVSSFFPHWISHAANIVSESKLAGYAVPQLSTGCRNLLVRWKTKFDPARPLAIPHELAMHFVHEMLYSLRYRQTRRLDIGDAPSLLIPDGTATRMYLNSNGVRKGANFGKVNW